METWTRSRHMYFHVISVSTGFQLDFWKSNAYAFGSQCSGPNQPLPHRWQSNHACRLWQCPATSASSCLSLSLSLCLFHLVVQGANSLKPKLKGWGTTNARNLLETFKQFLFSWMRVREIESEQECMESKRRLEKWLLVAWLKESHTSKAARHITAILLDFCTKRVLSHKDRSLAHLRHDHLTLH